MVCLVLIAAPAVYLSTRHTPASTATKKKSEVVSTKVETAPAPKCEQFIRDIKQGESLWKIAEKEYGGRSYMYPVLLEVNEIPNPNLILAGGTILIPCLCDLQPLLKKAVAKKTTPKVKVTKAVPPISATGFDTGVVISCAPCDKSEPTPKVSLVESPRPPPPPAVSTVTQNVIVNVTPAGVPAPAPQPVSQPAPPAQTQPLPAPPPLPTGFLAMPYDCGTGRINFSWNATPEEASYKIFRDGTLVKTTDNLAWSDTGLVAGKGYTYTLVASNAAGDSPIKWTTPPVTVAPGVCPVPTPAKPVAVVQPPVPVVVPVVPQPKMLVWSMWNTLEENPIEPGDKVNMFHADVGIVIGRIKKFQFEPFIAIDGVKDIPKGYSWNNRFKAQVGFKVVRPIAIRPTISGMVEFGVSFASETRFRSGGLPSQTKAGEILFFNGWFGHDMPTRHATKRKFFTGALPGTYQWWAGTLSPFEKDKGRFANFMGTIRLDQGFTLAKLGGVSFIPTGRFQFGFDTYGNPWNNRYTYGGGLKVAFPWKSGIMDFQGGYYCATQYVGTPVAGGSRCGPGFGVNFWTGGRKKLGGG
jgi:hypothetical protein